MDSPATMDEVMGYLDGRDPASPEPNANRTWAYCNSFAVGRREIAGKHRPAAVARIDAEIARRKDASL